MAAALSMRGGFACVRPRGREGAALSRLLNDTHQIPAVTRAVINAEDVRPDQDRARGGRAVRKKSGIQSHYVLNLSTAVVQPMLN